MAFGFPVSEHITFIYYDSRYIYRKSHDALVSLGIL